MKVIHQIGERFLYASDVFVIHGMESTQPNLRAILAGHKLCEVVYRICDYGSAINQLTRLPQAPHCRVLGYSIDEGIPRIISQLDHRSANVCRIDANTCRRFSPGDGVGQSQRDTKFHRQCATTQINHMKAPVADQRCAVSHTIDNPVRYVYLLRLVPQKVEQRRPYVVNRHTTFYEESQLPKRTVYSIPSRPALIPGEVVERSCTHCLDGRINVVRDSGVILCDPRLSHNNRLFNKEANALYIRGCV